MLSNTLTITIDGAAHTLVRVNQDNFSSFYTKKDEAFVMNLQVRHSVEKATLASPYAYDRHNMLFEQIVFATPTSSEKHYTVSHTMRVRQTSSPATLSNIDAGFSTLEGTLRASLVAGEP